MINPKFGWNQEERSHIVKVCLCVTLLWNSSVWLFLSYQTHHQQKEIWLFTTPSPETPWAVFKRDSSGFCTTSAGWNKVDHYKSVTLLLSVILTALRSVVMMSEVRNYICLCLFTFRQRSRMFPIHHEEPWYCNSHLLMLMINDSAGFVL